MYRKEPRYNEPLCNEDPGITNDIFQPNNSKMYGKEPRHDEPLCNEDPGKTNDILQPNNRKIYGKETRYKEPHFPSPLTLWYSRISLYYV